MAQRRGVYSGRSTEWTDDPTPSLKNAVSAAYAEAKRQRTEGDGSNTEGESVEGEDAQAGPFEFRVVEIRVIGTNPITDYVVDITDV